MKNNPFNYCHENIIDKTQSSSRKHMYYKDYSTKGQHNQCNKSVTGSSSYTYIKEPGNAKHHETLYSKQQYIYIYI